MTKTCKFTCLLIIAFMSLATGQASDWHDRSVRTDKGVVHFVSPDITAEELANLVFPPMEKKPLTRSMFNTVQSSVDVPVTIALLIQFRFDSAALTPTSKRRLNTLGQMLNMPASFNRSLIIEGHTDIAGSDEYNLGLSVRRAESVKSFLESNHSISGNRLIISGKGESELIDPEDPEGPINRRVQFSAFDQT